ncbi:MAG: peptide deformylase [Azoarcus sp.]|jgi:peptide deformylase|nr:peptide deformylase [Azoarcus sp.]
MALLPILRFPDSRLRTKAAPVDVIDEGIRQLVRDMAETMYAASGIGLAATQVNIHKRIAVIDVSEDRKGLLALINAQIIERAGECDSEEGCLSVPGVRETIRRAEWIKLRALDMNAKPFELEADGLLAICIQHELDHLDGKVFVEYLSRLKLNRIKTRLIKQAQEDKDKDTAIA